MFFRNMYRQCPSGTSPYVIQTGDTLYVIANRFGTTTGAIIAANPGIVPERLRIGQTICVPQQQTQPTVCPTGTAPYAIQRGDTLYLIAAKFNTNIQSILSANPGIAPERLYIGQTICVPRVAPEAPVCPIGTSPYEIKSGDTLASIARKFETTVQAIISANPDIVPERLSVGQVICVTQEKASEPPCPTLNYHVIRRGDTFATIARVYGISLQELLNANPNINPNNLYEGQVICIPVAASNASINVNISNKTLSLYKEGRFVKSYPVATGKPSTPTPVGTFKIINKQLNPGGPFGTRWMGLSEPHYGIHGTNNPSSIGTAASNGCIRMYNSDVEDLFNRVGVETVVRIY